jgi:hypothetical protein
MARSQLSNEQEPSGKSRRRQNVSFTVSFTGKLDDLRIPVLEF